jgi:hypothetical protein
MMLIGSRPSLRVVGVGVFVMLLVVPIANGCSQAIWQTKVAPDVQGRVFAIRRMLAWSSVPLATLLAGPLSDKVFNPLLLKGGLLAESVGGLIGIGSGRGIGFLLILLGCSMVLLLSCLSGIRNSSDWNRKSRTLQ